MLDQGVVIISDSEESDGPPRKKRAVTRGPLFGSNESANGIGKRGKQGSKKPSPAPVSRKGGLLLGLSQSREAPAANPLPKRAPLRPTSTELWSRKHAPKQEAQLIVHKKKLSELRDFLRSCVDDDGSSARASKLLLVSGPPGCGKSTAVRLVAAGMGFEVTEWEAPVPTLWAEHVLQAGMGQPYVSKLDAFDSFVSHAKLAPLDLHPISGSHTASQGKVGRGSGRKVILVDDLPQVNQPEQRRRLAAALGTLAETSRSPVVVIMTTSLSSSEKRSSGSLSSIGTHGGLSKALAASGASELSFNAIPATVATKRLAAIAEEESLPLSAAEAGLITERSGGDLMNAIETLQLYGCGKVDLSLAPAKKTKKGRGAARGKAKGRLDRADGPTQLEGLQRDLNLSTFHALGKLLYNKRGDAVTAEEPPGDDLTQGSQTQQERGSMTFDPEEVVMASGMEPGSVAAFLHENYLDFVHEDSIEDAAAACSYFSDADRLLSHSWASTSDVSMDNLVAGHNIADGCGGSVAARGVMWANAHPAPKKWLPLKGSAWFLVARAMQANMEQLQESSSRSTSAAWSGGSARQTAEGSLPYLRLMCSFPDGFGAAALLPKNWSRYWHGEVSCEKRPDEMERGTAGTDDNLEDAIEDDSQNGGFLSMIGSMSGRA